MSESQRRDLTDVRALKALAHPLRSRMLTWLGRNGPATSAMLATEFGEDRGATSYHLRQLARYGFIAEDTGRSAGRRRFWRYVSADIRLPDPRDLTDEARAATETIQLLWDNQATNDRARFTAERSADPAAYGELGAAAMSSQSTMRLTAAELRDFTEEYVALVHRWLREPGTGPTDARPVTALFQAFPTPGDDPDGGREASRD